MEEESNSNNKQLSKFAVSRRKRKLIELSSKTFSNLDLLSSLPPKLFNPIEKLLKFINPIDYSSGFPTDIDDEALNVESSTNDDADEESRFESTEEIETDNLLEKDYNSEDTEELENEDMHSNKKEGSFIDCQMNDYMYTLFWRPVVLAKDHILSTEPLVPAIAIYSIFGFRALKLSNCWEID
ncbi:hypothetical protein HCN44_010897 [Aphidius gifuensis]|uniref:Uncharacterized protein n=1 Tax=Aphidius gifuensis TaxID=684658 RepID=A0A835CVW6_APHGI|nr:hypothetical protein HCN44_010897 [Aphidius gifuensis]